MNRASLGGKKEIEEFRGNVTHYQWLIGKLFRWCLSAIVMMSVSFSAASEPIAVISHPELPKNEISLHELRSVYSLRVTRWPDDLPITVYVLPEQHDVHIAFAKDVLEIFPYQLKRYWDRLTFSGVSSGPIEVATEEEMRKRVLTTPGAIGYVTRQESATLTNYLEVTE